MFMYYPENRGWSAFLVRLINQVRNGGADFNECHRTLRRIRDGNIEDWYREWTRTAEYIEGVAEKALAKGHTVTARDHYQRAFNYYRIAEFYLAGRDKRKVPAYKKALSCFHKAGQFFSPPLARVEIPYDDTPIPGYFFPAPGKKQPAPAVIFVGGADSLAEELYFVGVNELKERGMSCILFDGPGQGHMLRLGHVYTRPDYEHPLSAVINFAQRQKEVDPKRIAILGISMGGYYGPRVAAFNKKVKACAVIGACYDVLNDLYDFYPPIRPQMEWIIGARNSAEAREVFREYSLAGVIREMECPLLITHGEDDFIVSVSAAYKTYEEARCPKELRIWKAEEGGSAHCITDNRAEAFSYIFDWLADKLK